MSSSSSSSLASSSNQSANIVINKHPAAMTTEPTESQLEIFRQANDFEDMKSIIETTNIDVNLNAAVVTAARHGRHEIVKLLIAAGADVNIVDQVNIYNNITC